MSQSYQSNARKVFSSSLQTSLAKPRMAASLTHRLTPAAQVRLLEGPPFTGRGVGAWRRALDFAL